MMQDIPYLMSETNERKRTCSRFKLHLVCGLPGSGKSTYGRKLAAILKATLLDIDTVTEPVVRAGLQLAGMSQDDRDSSAFKQAFREPIYRALFDAARDNLRHTDVVVCGPFTRELQQSDWDKVLCAQCNADVDIIYLYCPEPVRRKRIEARANPRDKAKLARWHEHIQEPVYPTCPHRFVDTSQQSV